MGCDAGTHHLSELGRHRYRIIYYALEPARESALHPHEHALGSLQKVERGERWADRESGAAKPVRAHLAAGCRRVVSYLEAVLTPCAGRSCAIPTVDTS